VAKLGFFY